MRHVIRKQVIDIQTDSAGGNYHLQQEISGYYQRVIVPALEKIFDELSDEDQVITFDHLEIDIRLIRKAETNEFISVEELYPLLRQQLEGHIRETKENESYSHFFRSEGGISLKKTPAVHAFEQWLYYMQNGVLPWNAYNTKEVIQTSVLESLSTKLHAVDHLAENVRNHPTIALRIIRLHEEKFRVNLIAALTAKNQDALPELIHRLKDFFPYSEQQKVSEELWVHVLLGISENNNQQDTTKLVLQAFEKMVAPENITVEKLIAMVEQLPALQSALPEYLHAILLDPKTKKETERENGNTFLHGDQKNNNALTKKKTRAISSKKKVDGISSSQDKEQGEIKSKGNKNMNTIQKETGMSSIDNQNKSISSEQGDQDDTIHAASQQPSKNTWSISETDYRQNSNELLEEGLFLKNAGLILLHPFFQFLFRNTGLSKGGVFIDRIAQQKAIYLLHYIACGETRADEHMLAMPKLICGWPVTELIAVDAGLTESMLTEADDLIRAAIAQWTILKNTSVEGLRESFLQREGKVFTKAEKLYIQIEKKSIDLLLDHLPWNISIVKFPWLKDIMWVEWR